MNISQQPCPICHQVVVIIGQEGKKKLASCGHKWSFKKTKSQKDMDKKYIKTEWGLELVK
jgi:hypothetical protein